MAEAAVPAQTKPCYAAGKSKTMLLELRLENYAVIDNLAVEFAAGLNLLTGETGAGKSILIDALALLLGEKASTDIIRAGAERTTLSVVFQLEGATEKTVKRVLDANGIDCEEEAILVRREISVNGKGRVFVNNQPATVAVLKQLAPHLATIHAQNESILSFDAAARLELLDAFAGIEMGPVSASFSRWKEIHERIEELQRDEQDRLRLVDLWTYQNKEIEEAKLQPGEDERLESEKRVLANAEKIYNAALNAFDLLYEGNGSTSSTLRAAQKAVEELTRYEPKFREAVGALENARISVEDVGATLRDYAGGIHASPEHLGEVEDRLAALDRLKRKYGPQVEDVIAFGADVNDLAIKATFRVQISSDQAEGNWTASGFDQVLYMIATNAGEPLRRLEQVASGGELSRVMLALKAVVEAGSTEGGRRKVVERTLVFDEIDTGIGGRAAEAVGKKLKALSRSNQVLCVTHLPQIATFADHHYVIQKRESGGRSRTSIREVAGEERTEEVARMLSGAKLTDTSRKHAEQMLKANA
jgi:DNA repair protein RecN (Recombination protein N)